jgi:hypothetical protein
LCGTWCGLRRGGSAEHLVFTRPLLCAGDAATQRCAREHGGQQLREPQHGMAFTLR